MVDVTETLAGRYRLLEVVGRGSMGEVWRARDEVLQREVAAKIISQHKQTDPIAVKRFQREAIAMANLFHPNVVSVYDVGSQDDRPFMIMELLTGPSVARLIADLGQLDLERVLRMGAQVARGLSAAHAIGVTHRDIKPGNILKHEKVTKIVDFGIARLEDTVSNTLTSPAMAIGTAAYMSPEQARGKAVQAPSDVYSLACLLTAMLTGRPPFVNDDPIEVARAHAMDQPEAVSHRRPDVPADLEKLIMTMLAKRPMERPTAPEVAVELTRLQSEMLGHADPSSPFSPLASRAPGPFEQQLGRGPAPVPTPEVAPSALQQPAPDRPAATTREPAVQPRSMATPVQPPEATTSSRPQRWWQRRR